MSTERTENPQSFYRPDTDAPEVRVAPNTIPFGSVTTDEGTFTYDKSDPADVARVSKLTGMPVESVPAVTPEATFVPEFVSVFFADGSSLTYAPADIRDCKRIAGLCDMTPEALSGIKAGAVLNIDSTPVYVPTPDAPTLRVAVVE